MGGVISERILERKLADLRQLRQLLLGLLENGGSTTDLKAALARMGADTRAHVAPPLQQLKQLGSELLELGRQRLRGQYETDEFGLDPQYPKVLMPIFHLFYRHYFRAQAEGVAHIPSEGPTLLVANHAGILFWDGAMVAAAIDLEHPQPRPMRAVFLSWFANVPFVAPLLARCGHVQAMPENTRTLLERGEMVAVFPEGMKGAAKMFRDRYRLKRFGRGGFLKVAIETGAKLVPVSVVGAEETYPMLYRLGGSTGALFGLPFVPVTPTFPWLGPLGVIPLPSRFRIRFHEPIDYGAVDRAKASDFTYIEAQTQRVRGIIQSSIDELREARGHPYFNQG